MPQEWQEVIEPLLVGSLVLKRRRCSKSHRLHIDGQPTNKFSLDATIGPLHYEDDQGDFQDIQTELVPSSQSITGFGNPAFEMVENEYEMYVLGALNSGVPLVRYKNKLNDYWVQFAAHNLQWRNDLDQLSFIATPGTTATEISENKAKWPDAYGAGIDLRFIAGMGRMQKWLDLWPDTEGNSPLPDPPEFIVNGGNPVLEFAEILSFHSDLDVYVNGLLWNKNTEVGTTSEIEFRSPDGEVQFVFPVAVGYQEGEGESVRGQIRLRKSGNKLYVTARFPHSWLQAATYPVHLDTTVDKQTALSGDDGQRTDATGFITDEITLRVGRDAAPSIHHIFARWDDVSIAGTIGVSHIKCFACVAGDAERKVYVVDEDDPAAPTTYQEFDADPLYSGDGKDVDWDDTWAVSTWEESPSLNVAFQQYVDDYGPIENKAVMVQVKDDGSGVNHCADARSWDYTDNTYGPKLHIEYSLAYSIAAGAGSYALTGAAVGLPIGRVIGAGAGSYAITGTVASLLKDLLIGAGVGSYTLSGDAVSLPVDRVIGAGAGSYSLTGATAALFKDMLISAGVGNYTLAGTAASFGRAMGAAPGSYALAGSDVDLIKAMIIGAGAGAYNLTGSAVSLPLDRVIGAGSGAYAITGSDADFIKAMILSAAGGTYALNGIDAALVFGRVISAGAGSYSLIGSDVDLIKDVLIPIGAGSYSITGQDANLLRDLIIPAGGGAYVLTGTGVLFPLNRVIAIGPGSYILAGSDISLPLGRSMPAGGGSYTVAGQDVSLPLIRVITAGGGSYAITGAAAGLLLDWMMQALEGSYSITGSSADLLKDLIMQALGDSYAITGQDVRLGKDVGIDIESGAYVLSGTAATLTVLGLMLLHAKPRPLTLHAEERQ